MDIFWIETARGVLALLQDQGIELNIELVKVLRKRAGQIEFANYSNPELEQQVISVFRGLDFGFMAPEMLCLTYWYTAEYLDERLKDNE